MLLRQSHQSNISKEFISPWKEGHPNIPWYLFTGQKTPPNRQQSNTTPKKFRKVRWMSRQSSVPTIPQPIVHSPLLFSRSPKKPSQAEHRLLSLDLKPKKGNPSLSVRKTVNRQGFKTQKDLLTIASIKKRIGSAERTKNKTKQAMLILNSYDKINQKIKSARNLTSNLRIVEKQNSARGFMTEINSIMRQKAQKTQRDSSLQGQKIQPERGFFLHRNTKFKSWRQGFLRQQTCPGPIRVIE